MELLYIGNYMFKEKDDAVYGLPSSANSFFGKYLDVFGRVRILGEGLKSYLTESAMVRMDEKRFSVRILPRNRAPKDLKNDFAIKKILQEEIAAAEAIIIKPLSRKGLMAIKIAEKLRKPYMIEVTGDIHNALCQHPSRIRRAYAPILYNQIKRTIRKCKFALYVSRDYLQGKYPIQGQMCGCSDVELEPGTDDILERRMQKIDAMQADQTIHLALVGFYQGNGKGVDTALRALGRLPENYHLSVLGNGTQQNREKWYAYAETCGVRAHRLHFPEPLPSAQAVLHWLDDFDFFVFPTRSEGFGRVVAEAMSRGLPCLATNICTMPELLPRECLFELDDDSKLAEQLLAFVNDKEQMKTAARINFEHAKDYAFELLKKRRNEFLAVFKDYCLEQKNGKD